MNTGVSCHFLLQCMKVKSESEVTQLCLTVSDPMDRSRPGSSFHGIFQARVPEWVAIAFPDIKEMWKRYTELYKKDLHNQENNDGVITHLEPDILECEVKRALGSITMNKASGGDGIPVELFQFLKDDAVEVLHSICQKIWKLSNGHGTGKRQFSFQSQRKQCQRMLKLLHNCIHLTR